MMRIAKFDKGFAVLIIVSHILFYYALHCNHKPLIDALHYLIYISLVVGIFLKNTTLLCMCLSLLIVIQIMWKLFGDCVLNRVSHIEHGHSQLIENCVFVLTVLYLLKLCS